jgi:hypothetical protein
MIASTLGTRNQKSVGNLFAQTASVTVANTVTETTLLGSGSGTLTLPANFLKVGTSLRLRAAGYHSSTGNPTITIRIKLGSTTIATMSGTGGNGTNDSWEVNLDLTVRTVGASGTIFAQGKYAELHSAGLVAGSDNTVTTTIDTTASITVNMTLETQ